MHLTFFRCAPKGRWFLRSAVIREANGLDSSPFLVLTSCTIHGYPDDIHAGTSTVCTAL